MSDADAKTPWHLWLVGLLGLVWNGFGATDYTMTQSRNRDWFTSMGYSDTQADAMLAFMDTYPALGDALWALGVWGGLVGAILLLLRKGLAVPMFAASLIGAVGSLYFQFSTEVPAELAELNNSNIMFVVVAIALFLLWYSWTMRKRGVLS